MAADHLPDIPRIHPGMRKSMFQLQDKSRFVRRPKPSPRKARSPGKKTEAPPPPATRDISALVKEYKETLAKLDDIEAELAEWLSSPIEDPSKEGEASPVTAAVRDEIAQLSEPSTEAR